MEKVYYICPSCSSEVWVDGAFVNYRDICLKCMNLQQYDKINSEEYAITKAFLKEQRKEENGHIYDKGGWNELERKWYPFEANEGFFIAFGHKIKENEDLTDGLTEKMALILHKKDWEIHYLIAKADFEEKTGKIDSSRY